MRALLLLIRICADLFSFFLLSLSLSFFLSFFLSVWEAGQDMPAVEAHVLRRGPPDAPVLLLIHGNGISG